MSKEAKVGLLLGLVFIVGIAVILRGVHEDSQDETAERLVVTPIDSSETDRAVSDAVKDLVDPIEQRDDQVMPLGGEQENRVVADSPGEAERDASVRYEQELPRAAQEGPLVAMEEDRVGRLAGQAAGKDRDAVPLVVASHGSVGGVFGGDSLERVRRLLNGNSKGRTYEVREGDNLSKIALKVYPGAAGKRWVNVVKIFQANRKVLASMDEVKPGQKLQIPELAVVEVVSSDSGIGRAARAVGASKRRSEDATGGHYVVQDGDSLWRIATQHLGSGLRYPELVKLNADKLGDESRLAVGMRLRLPKP